MTPLLLTLALAAPPGDRAAWDAAVARGPAGLADLVEAAPGDDPVRLHWVASAARRVIDNAAPGALKQADLARLRNVLDDAARPGPARRLALEALEAAEPGSQPAFSDAALADPEFGPDAVARALARVAELEKAGERDQASAAARAAFEAATDPAQVAAVAAKWKALGGSPDLAARLGAVKTWDMGVRLDAGPDGKVDVLKARNGDESGRVMLTAIVRSDTDRSLELRVAAVDNVLVTLNGAEVLKHDIPFRSLYRVDRHRDPVRLKAGDNALRVTLWKVPPEPGERGSGGPKRWDVLVRFVDARGAGVALVQTPGGVKP